MSRLTPAPGRGAVLAAGAVVLATFAILADVRFAHRWDAGPRVLLFGVLAVLIGTLAARAPMVRDTPLPYHATLQVAAIVLGGLALLNLADALGAAGQLGGAGEVTWTGAVLGLVALAWARRTNSAIMTLAAALLGVLVVATLVAWVFGPESLQTVRWLLLVCALALTLGAVWLRDRARRHAVSLVDVAGVAIFVLGLTLAGVELLPVAQGVGLRSPHPLGWLLVLLAFGFGLVAYGAVDRERVPPFLGILLLVLVVVLAGLGSRSFVGWPLALGVIGAVLLVIGLRPRQELPPEPPVGPR